MATTLQSFRPPFHPSISPLLHSRTFPAASTVTYSPKFMIPFPNSSSLITRKIDISSRASSSEYSPTIAETLGQVSIFTAEGDPVLFKDLWDQEQGVAVVALLRHFGCPCCWELASTLKQSESRFDSAGVKLIAVGIGTPEKARILAGGLLFPMHCLYADPERKAYDVLNLYYGLGRTFFNPASVKVLSRFGALQKATKNYTIEATPADRSGVLQQGGMFVFRGKELLYARKDEGTGDHAPLDDVFDVCCKVPVSPSAMGLKSGL